MNKRYFAIGDIHGNYTALMDLFKKLEDDAHLDEMEDTVVFLGDFIDRGADTNKVIEQLIFWKKMYPHWQFLKGNHEDLMLDAFHPKHPKYGDYYLWWNQGGEQTLKSYQTQELSEYEKAIMQPKDYIPEEHFRFLRELKYYYETDQYFFVHGGVLPDTPLRHQDFDHPVIQDAMIWARESFYESEYMWEKKIIFGHTTFFDFTPEGTVPMVLKKPNMIGIDTLNGEHGFLCALELPSETVWKY